jgi:hypothetical protein
MKTGDRDLIVQEYERRENDAGGVANINPRQVLADIAEEVGVSTKDARGVMLDHWNMVGVG